MHSSTNKIVLLIMFSVIFALSIDYSSAVNCSTVLEANTVYTLTEDLYINGSTCFNISVENVTIDCNGFSITGNYSTSIPGIFSSSFNTTIDSCSINAFLYGIYFDSVNNGLIQYTNVSVDSWGFGIYFYNSSNNLIRNTTSSTDSGAGIYLEELSTNNIVSNSTGGKNQDSGAGIVIYGSNNSIVSSIGISNSSVGISLSGYGILANSIINSQGLSNSDSGIVVYGWNNVVLNSSGNSSTRTGILVIGSNNTIINSTGSSLSYYGIIIQGNYNQLLKVSGLSVNNTGLCLSDSNGNNISDSVGLSFSGIGMNFKASFDNILMNSYVEGNNSDGALYFEGAFNSTVINTTINGRGGTYSLKLDIFSDESPIASTYNSFINNTFLNSTTHIYLHGLSNLFHGNNFGEATGYYVQNMWSYNQFNTSINGVPQGNYYYDISSLRIYDSDNDGWGDYGTDYPLNATTWPEKWSGDGADYGPATTNTKVLCSTPLQANTVYTLTEDLYINGSTCFNITAENVTIDCSGFYIRGNNSESTYGVFSNQPGTNISNCDIGFFHYGVYFYNLSRGNIANTRSNSTLDLFNANGIWLSRTTNTTIINSTGISNTYYGIWLDTCQNITITNSIGATYSKYGLYLSYSTSNSIINTSGISESVYAYGLDIHASSNNIISNSVSISKGVQPALYLLFGSSNNTISNSRFVSHAGVGVWITGSSNNHLLGNILNGSQSIFFQDTHGNVVFNNTLVSVNETPTLLLIDSSSYNNSFYHNNFTNIQAGYYVQDLNGNNTFNTSINGVPQGNYYYDISSLRIYDSDNDGWGDTGSDYPLSNSTWPSRWSGYGTDYGPATTREESSRSSSGGDSYNIQNNKTEQIVPESVTEFILSETITKENIKANMPEYFSFKDLKIPINDIIINPNSFLEDVKLRVSVYDSKPSHTSKTISKVYKYLEIQINVNNTQINNGSILFSVTKAWLKEQGVDKKAVYLIRWKDNKWNELDTSIYEEKNDSIIYIAQTPGFSIFAIAIRFETGNTVYEPVNLSEEPKTVIIVNPEKIAKKTTVFATPIIMIIAVIIMIASVGALSAGISKGKNKTLLIETKLSEAQRHKIREYINRAKELNASDEKIIEKLRKGGLSDEQISTFSLNPNLYPKKMD